MRLLEQIPETAGDWRILVGLCMLWFPLMVSPYYPFWLSPAFAQSDITTISLWHSLYSAALLVGFLLILKLRHRRPSSPKRTFPKVVALGAAISAVLFMLVPGQSSLSIVLAVCTTIFTALYVALFLVIWTQALTGTQNSRPALTLCSSFIGFCALWCGLLLAGPFTLRLATALSPLVAFFCLVTPAHPSEVPGSSIFASDQATSLKALPLGIIGICVILIYFAALAVRAFTAMGTGVPAQGNVGVFPQLATVLGALIMVAAFGLVFSRRNASTVNIMLLVTALALVYMAALLIITLADPSGWLVLGAKRILVAAQHSTEVLLFAILAEAVVRRNLSPQQVFGVAGIVACVGPQFVSLDILHNTGAMNVIAKSPHIALIASVAAFLIAALAMAMLATYARRLVSDIEVKGDEWVRELCKRATAAYVITPRELDVVVLTYRGYSAPKIAEELMVSESTVKAHLAHSYRKLNIHSKQELIALIDSYGKG